MWSQWAPPMERSRLALISYTGNNSLLSFHCTCSTLYTASQVGREHVYEVLSPLSVQIQYITRYTLVTGSGSIMHVCGLR